jgi:hypothetical protein
MAMVSLWSFAMGYRDAGGNDRQLQKMLAEVHADQLSGHG